MVEVGERDDEADAVLFDERRQRSDVAGVVDWRHERAPLRGVERGRELVDVGSNGRRAGLRERLDDVDALPGTGEEND